MRRATDMPALMRRAMALRVAVAGPIVQTMRVRGLSVMEVGIGYTVAPRDGMCGRGPGPIYTEAWQGANRAFGGQGRFGQRGVAV